MAPREENGCSPWHELVRVMIALRSSEEAVALSVSLPATHHAAKAHHQAKSSRLLSD